MDISLSGKRALVTGAGQGIGKDIALRLSQCGAQVFAISKTAENLTKLKEECPSIETVQVDISDWNATRNAVTELGDIHLLVNNAGIAKLESFLHVKPDTFDTMMNVNVKAAINVSQVVAQRMILQKLSDKSARSCAIVNVSSVAAQHALLDHTVYCATKAALDMVTKSMALELGEHGIRVNSVNPTVVMTEMGKKAWGDPAKSKPVLDRIPLGRFAECADVSDVVLYLLSDYAQMINGSSIMVDGVFCAS